MKSKSIAVIIAIAVILLPSCSPSFEGTVEATAISSYQYPCGLIEIEVRYNNNTYYDYYENGDNCLTLGLPKKEETPASVPVKVTYVGSSFSRGSEVYIASFKNSAGWIPIQH